MTLFPADIVGYDRLQYGWDNASGFCERLTNALQSVLQYKYKQVYDQICEAMSAFNEANRKTLRAKEFQPFKSAVMCKEKSVKMPPITDKGKALGYVSAIIIDGVLDIDSATEFRAWIEQRYPCTAK
jgi:hypothetical protein